MASPFSFVEEYEYNTILAAMCVSHCFSKKIDCKVFLRDLGKIERAYHFISEWNPDVVCELHFNSIGIDTITGFEVLCGPQRGSYELAENIIEWLRDSALPTLRNRGVKKVKSYQRGYKNVSQLDIPSVLVEPFFGSNPKDCIEGLDNMKEIAMAIVDGCISYWSQEATAESRH